MERTKSVKELLQVFDQKEDNSLVDHFVSRLMLDTMTNRITWAQNNDGNFITDFRSGDQTYGLEIKEISFNLAGEEVIDGSRAEFELCAYALSDGDGTTPYLISVEKTPRGEENALEKLFTLAKSSSQRSHISAIGIVKKYLAISQREEAIDALARGYRAMKKP